MAGPCDKVLRMHKLASKDRKALVSTTDNQGNYQVGSKWIPLICSTCSCSFSKMTRSLTLHSTLSYPERHLTGSVQDESKGMILQMTANTTSHMAESQAKTDQDSKSAVVVSFPTEG